MRLFLFFSPNALTLSLSPHTHTQFCRFVSHSLSSFEKPDLQTSKRKQKMDPNKCCR